MRISIALVCLVAGCVSHSHQADLADIFEVSYHYIHVAAKAGQRCQTFDIDYNPQYPRDAGAQCVAMDLPFDRQACIVFDTAIQEAILPLSICGNAEMLTRHTDLETKCQLYMEAFLTPCVGAQAMQLAYKERAISQAYRDAVQAGMSAADAEAAYLDKLVRLRH